MTQDHFVACSYISEKEVYSLRGGGSIIYGFDQFEDGALMIMGNGDIDSLGRDGSQNYNGAKHIEARSENAKFFAPSELTKASIAKGYGYNEVVIERRDENNANGISKRKPK